MGAKADLRGMFGMVLPEVRGAVGAYGTALPKHRHYYGGTILTVMQFAGQKH